MKLELLSDNELLLMVGKGIRGGICLAVHRYDKANKSIWKLMIKTKNHHISCI